MKEEGEKVYVKNVAEFISRTTEIITKIRTQAMEIKHETPFWFRGEKSEDYELVPNLFRKLGGKEYCCEISASKMKELQQVEGNIDTSFYRMSSKYFGDKKIENTIWNRYFLKQHYGIQTRLLDWTENALVALFIAVKEAEKENKNETNHNARVWILSPVRLNNYTVFKLTNKEGAYNIFTFSDVKTKDELHEPDKLMDEERGFNVSKLSRKYYKLICTAGEKMYPLAIYPPHLDDRMAAQQACFTIFGNIVKGFNCEDAKEKFLDCVYIPKDSKKHILQELRLLGISYYSIKPDLDGLGETISFDYRDEINEAY